MQVLESPIRLRVSLFLLLIMLLNEACATRVSREIPLEQWAPEEDRCIEAQMEGDRSPELVVLLAFLGGGTRAASFAYGCSRSSPRLR